MGASAYCFRPEYFLFFLDAKTMLDTPYRCRHTTYRQFEQNKNGHMHHQLASVPHLVLPRVRFFDLPKLELHSHWHICPTHQCFQHRTFPYRPCRSRTPVEPPETIFPRYHICHSFSYTGTLCLLLPLLGLVHHNPCPWARLRPRRRQNMYHMAAARALRFTRNSTMLRKEALSVLIAKGSP